MSSWITAWITAWIPVWFQPNFLTLSEQLQQPYFQPLLLLRYAFEALLCSLPIFAADYLLGLGLLRRMRINLAPPLHRAAAMAIGMGTAATGIFFFGSFGRLTGKGMLAFTALEAMLGLALLWPLTKPPRLRLRWRWSYLLALTLFIPYFLDLMLPLLEYDSTMYHMAFARWYMEKGKLLYHDGLRFNAQPHLPVMLYMRHWWLLNDAALLKLVNLQYMFVLLGTFTWAARRFRIPGGAWLAAGLVLGSPIFSFITRVEYADFALTVWLGLGSALLTLRHPRARYAAALCLGFCAASKLQGMVVVACFLTADFAVSSWRERRIPWARSLVLGATVILLGLPWWIRSYVNTGSPFAPFLTASPDVASLFVVNRNYGVGRDLWAFLATPWNMITVNPEKYADLFRFGPSCLLLLTFAAAALLLRRGKTIDRGSAFLALGSLLFTLFWFRSGQVMRYEACLLPGWALLLLASLARFRPLLHLCRPLLILLLLSTSFLASNMIRFGLPPAVTWPATQATLSAVLPYYRATQVLNRFVKPNDRVYTWFCDDAKAYVPGKAYGDWFSAYDYHWLGNTRAADKITSVEGLLARLKANGFRYVMLDRERAAQGGTIYTGSFLSTGFVKRFVPIPGIDILYDDGKYLVFRLP
jgi:hypothetical protein